MLMAEPDPSAQTIEDEGKVSTATHMFLGVAGVTCVGFLVWMSFGTLDIVAVATGEVIPSSQVKSIQHLEGGIVDKILVREGETVKQDQPLIELRTVTSDVDVNEVNLRIAARLVDLARLEAETEGRPSFAVPSDLLKAYPDLITQAQQLFESRRDRFQASVRSQKEIISQREQALQETQARLKNNQDVLHHLREQIRIGNELLKSNLGNKYEHLTLLRDESSLKGKLEEDAAGVRRLESALKEAKVQLDGLRLTFQEDVAKEVPKTQRELDELNQRLRKLSDSLSRTVLRAPVNGIVKALYVVTEGGVVQAGKTVLDLVPLGDKLIVEAKLPTFDIGYIRLGQSAVIKMMSPDAARFGDLFGKVIHVSPDTLVSPEGMAYYKVRIETDKDHFQRGNLEYRLFPGIQVSASIQTGQRTVMEYLLDPFISSATDAMRER
jgi:adhesin transport system membrane fusion protein